MKKFFLAVVFAIAVTIPVFAQNTANQNLKGKLGIGFNTTWRHDLVPALVATYWLTDTVGIEGFTGFETGNGSYDNSFVIGGRALHIIRSYKDLNIFKSTALTFESVRLKQDDSYTNMMAFLGGIGLEWFVLGNLSLSTEMGLKLSSTGDGITRLSSYISTSVKFYM
jgi:hypothetical protein